jgi:hypothetical protein
MTEEERGPGEERDRGRCSDCDPGLLDDLKCQATGIAAQAAYNADHGQELDDARAAFMTARAAYNAARSAAVPLVAEAHRNLEELEDRVRCQLDRDGVECINLAFGRIVERLDECGHERGCCCDEDCDFDDDVRDCDPDDVPGRLAVIERRTKEAAECFWDLIGEHTVVPPPQPAPVPAPGAGPAAPAAPGAAAPAPAPAAAAGAPAAPPATAPAAAAAPALAALPARVQAVRDEIDAIAKAAADGSWEPPRLYAAVLVARRHLKDVWRGFHNVNEYWDCLCRALTCMIKGHAAIGELTRQAAVNQCKRDSWKAACKYLADNTVAEVLAEFLRVCAEDHDDDHDHDHDHDDDHDHDRDHDRDRDRDRGDDDRDRDGRGRDDDRDRDRDERERAGQRPRPDRDRDRDASGRYRRP